MNKTPAQRRSPASREEDSTTSEGHMRIVRTYATYTVHRMRGKSRFSIVQRRYKNNRVRYYFSLLQHFALQVMTPHNTPWFEDFKRFYYLGCDRGGLKRQRRPPPYRLGVGGSTQLESILHPAYLTECSHVNPSTNPRPVVAITSVWAT